MTKEDTYRSTGSNATTAKAGNEHSTTGRAYLNSLGGEVGGLAPSETSQSINPGSVPMHVNHKQAAAYSTLTSTVADPAARLADRCFRLLEQMEATAGDISDELTHEEDELETHLVNTPALTVAGVAAKLRTALWVDGDEDAPTDVAQALLWSALHDLERMAATLGLPLAPPPSYAKREHE